MNKLFYNTQASTTETQEKKTFSFRFTVDDIEDKESTAAKKKSKSKPKKKKKKPVPGELESPEPECYTPDNENAHIKADKFTSGASPQAKYEVRMKIDEISGIVAAPAPAQGFREAVSDEECTKKKKKKDKKKIVPVAVVEVDDDMDFLTKEIALLAAAQLTSPSPTKASHAPKNNKSNNGQTASTRKMPPPPEFSFKSHKDLELSDEQRNLFRYGNGKNLVAIGPPKHKGDPIWKLSPPPGLKLPDNHENSYQDNSNNNSSGHSSDNNDAVNDVSIRSISENGDRMVPSLLSNDSPFCFGFGL